MGIVFSSSIRVPIKWAIGLTGPFFEKECLSYRVELIQFFLSSGGTSTDLAVEGAIDVQACAIVRLSTFFGRVLRVYQDGSLGVF